jgi:hypothetical protein
VGVVGANRHPTHPYEYQTYAGYDVWAPDARMPNFTVCTLMTCHPKSVVRPAAVEVMSIHHVNRVKKGFVQEPRLLDPAVAFTRHLRCLYDPKTMEWDTTTAQPLCSDEEVLHPGQSGGVPVCPADVIADVHRRYANQTGA